ncbi:sigma-70 family RNA polymerase sigma factor [Janibacter corallicola]|uniref:sigma-70 family RNA polymerase sigma factor n=1 Tax=Janibacter corallicola TaxID=415212 RepID=UPI00083677D0|nr:sigma-70 family RNA polymerase sigma factor [Janibacter corallicola]
MTSVVRDQTSDHRERDRHAALELGRACQETDPTRAARIREEVVIANRGLAIGLARRFGGRGIERDDLVQVAMLGLVQAARRYRPDRGHGFSAFAAPTIIGELKRYFRDHGWAVRPPRGLQELHHDVRDTAARMEQENQRKPTEAEVAAEMDLSVEQVRTAGLVGDQYRSSSLDTPARESSEQPLIETIAAEEEDPNDKTVTLVSLREAMGTLDTREQRVLRLRFVKDLTQREIGERIGVSQMQVSRILTSVYARLRTRIEGEDATAGSGSPRG